MPRLTLNRLEPGMVLAEAALGPRGNVLLGEGAELDQKQIRALQTWGVNAVTVEGEDDTAVDLQLSEEELAAAEELVAPRFRHADLEEPVTACLYSYAIRQAAVAARNGS